MNLRNDDLDAQSTEYLLERYAVALELPPKQRDAIALELRSRGVTPPSEGTQPIPTIQTAILPDTRLRRGLRTGFMILCMLILAGFTKQFANSFVGFAVTVAFALYALYDWIGRKESTAEGSAKQTELTPLMLAAADGDLATVRKLLDAGAQADATAADGTTALMYAARNGRTEVIAELLVAGADPLRQSRKGSTALSIAERFKHVEAARTLGKRRSEA